MRRVIAGILMATLVAAAGCNRQTAPAGEARPRVALVLKTLNHPYFLDMQRGAREAAGRLGVELVVQAAERELDVEKQVQIIENLVQAGVSALCVAPSGSREVVSAIAKANQAGIPVVVVDTRVDADAAAAAGLKLVSFIGSDNYQGGRIAGEFLVRESGGTAKVAILEGIPGHETGDSRLRGFRDAIAASPGIRVLASQPANWERDQGFTVFQNLLQAHRDLDTVFACNDLMALGALEAIAAAGRDGHIRVIGYDALDDARKAIAEGRMDASVAQSPEEMGRLAIETAVKAIRGEAVPAEQMVAITLVTREAAGAAPAR